MPKKDEGWTTNEGDPQARSWLRAHAAKLNDWMAERVCSASGGPLLLAAHGDNGASVSFVKSGLLISKSPSRNTRCMSTRTPCALASTPN